MVTAFNLRHNKYVSIPDWFKDTNSNVDQPTEDRINTITSVSGGSSVVTAGPLLFTLYNKYVLKPATETQSILTIENKALIAVVKEGETTNLGDEVDAQGWNTSDYFDIAAETLITVTGQTSDQYGIVFYNNVKQVINAVPITSSPIEIMTPIDAFYCRISSMPVETFSINYYSPNSYTDSQLNLSNQNVTDYLALNAAIPEGYNKVSFEGNAFNLLVQKPLTLTKDNNNVIKLSLSQSSALSDGVWELRTDESSNQQYIYTTYPVVTQHGITTYADVDNLDIDSIYDGLPIDNQTIYWVDVKEEVGTDEEGNPIYETVRVLKANVGNGGGSSVDLSELDKRYLAIDGTAETAKKLSKTIKIWGQPFDGTGNITGELNLGLSGRIRKPSAYETYDNIRIEMLERLNNIPPRMAIQASDYNGVSPQGFISIGGVVENGKENKLQHLFLFALTTSVFGKLKVVADNAAIGTSAKGVTLQVNESGVLIVDAGNGFKIDSLIYDKSNNQLQFGGDLLLNEGLITYDNEKDYFKLDGDLLVTGGITAFADSGSGNQWIISADELENITSEETTKVYSANVTTAVAKKVIDINNSISTINNKLNDIKIGLKGINSNSSASAIGTALKKIYDELIEYDKLI